MFARSSSAKNKHGKLNPTINEKYNIIRGHSSYIYRTLRLYQNKGLLFRQNTF